MATIVVFLGAGLLLLKSALRRPGLVTLGVLLVAALLNELQIGVEGVNLGVTLYISDVACVVLIWTSVLMLKKCPENFPSDAKICVALTLLLVLNLSRGISTYGLKAAGNGSRDLRDLLLPALAIMCLGSALRLDTMRLARWIGFAGLLFTAVAVLRWTGLLATPVDPGEDFREVARNLTADAAIVVGQGVIAVLYLHLAARRNTWWLVATGVLGMVTLALQHRSVWTATAAGVAWLMLRIAQRSPASVLKFGATAMLALCVITVAVPSSLKIAQEMGTANIQEVESENSTWAWRVAGYEEASTRLLSSDPLDLLIGPPCGWAAGFVGENASSTFIHSRFIDTLANFGVVGFTVLILWFGMLVKRTGWPKDSISKMASGAYAGGAFIEALLISQLVYLIPYIGGLLQGAVLGLIWVAARQNSMPSTNSRVALTATEHNCLS